MSPRSLFAAFGIGVSSGRAQWDSPLSQGLALCGLLPVTFFLCHMALVAYLDGLDRPYFFEFGLMTSLVITCVYEFKEGVRCRQALVACLFNSILFLCGAVLAPWIRHEYIAIVASALQIPDTELFLGHDLFAALSARLVGFGGCLAVGALIARLTVGRQFARQRFERLFIAPQHRAVACPCCGQATFKSASCASGKALS